jgi:hypothetical protein
VGSEVDEVRLELCEGPGKRRIMAGEFFASAARAVAMISSRLYYEVLATV